MQEADYNQSQVHLEVIHHKYLRSCKAKHDHSNKFCECDPTVPNNIFSLSSPTNMTTKPVRQTPLHTKKKKNCYGENKSVATSK
jgi:hypothetical protein